MLNARAQSGYLVINTTGAAEVKSQTVEFDTPFAKNPHVFVNIRTTRPGERFATASSITSSQFTLNTYSEIADDLGVDWYAVIDD